MSLLHELAEYIQNISDDDVSKDAYEAALMNISDTIGCMIGGCKAPGIPQLIEFVRETGGREEATMLLDGAKFPAAQAAFVNSAMAHALDFDQVHKPSALHIMVLMLPVCLAIAEKQGNSGKEFLASMILGIEAACRIGLAFVRHKPSGRYPGFGFLPTTVVGGFGAALAASRLSGFDVEKTVNAMGLYYAQASGNRQALFDKTAAKRLQPAFAARDAVWATALAGKGISGPSNALEGRAGLFSIYRNSAPPSCEELLEKHYYYEIERGSFKRYPVCGQTVAHVAVGLGRKNRFSASDIKKLEIYLGGNTDGLTAGPFFLGDTPQANAQFSSAYAVAAGLLKGRISPFDITEEEVIGNRNVREIAERVVVCSEMDGLPPPLPDDKEWSPDGNRYYAVKVLTSDCREYFAYSTVRDACGLGAVTKSELREKYDNCVAFSGLFSTEKANEIYDTIYNLAEAPNLEKFIGVIGLEKL